MSTYNYQTAIAVLSESDKNRLVCLYLNSDAVNNNSAVNWQKATTEFGAASVVSMRTMTRYALKKIEKAEAAGGAGGSMVPPTPRKASPAKGGRKRKAAADAAADEGGDDVEETPKPKAKKGRKAKAKTPTPDTDGDDEGGEAVVKGENGDSD